MTLYAGEALELSLADVAGRPTLTVRSPTQVVIVWQGSDQGDSSITASNVTSVQVSVVAADDTVVLFSDMAYDSPNSRWKLLWLTEGLAPGRYVAQATIDATEGTRSWEFGVIRLRAGKTPSIIVDGGGAAPAGESIDGGTPSTVGVGVLDGGTI